MRFGLKSLWCARHPSNSEYFVGLKWPQIITYQCHGVFLKAKSLYKENQFHSKIKMTVIVHTTGNL